MANEELLQEEETSIITMTDENGEEVNFEYLDCVEYEGKEYLVLIPAEEESNEIVILEVEPVDEELENYLAVENEEILQEEESILSLTDENGEEMQFEYMDCIEYNGSEYLVLSPVEEPGQIVILKVEPVDEENENYVAVMDEDILDAVYDIFKARYQDILQFEE